MNARGFSERDIHMALDGELPEDEAAEFQDWLAVNPEMRARAARFEADRALLRQACSGVLEEPLPERLLHAVSGDSAPSARTRMWRMVAAAALVFCVGAGGGYLAGTGGLGFAGGASERLAEQAIAAHSVYAAENRHAVEVGADDREHLLRWLSNRTGVTLIAPDLAADGFELVGGRLLPAGRRTAALLLYEDATKNRISVYVTAEGRQRARGSYSEAGGGPRAIYWLDPGYGCAIVGTLPQERLAEVARKAYRQLLAGAGIG